MYTNVLEKYQERVILGDNTPCAVDSTNGQQPARAPIPRRFSQLLQVNPCSHQYLFHPLLIRPSTPPPPFPCQHRLFLQTGRLHHVPEKHHLLSCSSLKQ